MLPSKIPGHSSDPDRDETWIWFLGIVTLAALDIANLIWTAYATISQANVLSRLSLLLL